MEEREIITLLLGVAVLGYVYFNRGELGQLPSPPVLFASFIILLAGWLFTVIEVFVWPNALNTLEHICYTTSSVILAWWCWSLFHSNTGA